MRFVLAGAGSEVDEKAIKKLIDEKGVSDNVEFPGWVRGDTKDKLLREADVFFCHLITRECQCRCWMQWDMVFRL